MNIGNFKLKHGVFLAPMANITDYAYRSICVSYGAECVCTELISSKGVVHGDRKTDSMAMLREDERPAAIQIFGHEPEVMGEAAYRLQKFSPAFIDINFGCPVKKIASRGAGSGMMRDVPLMVEMTRQIVQAVETPVTVKTRLGWDEDSKIIVELAERLQDVGIQGLTIHGRTRCQMYKGEADWTLIGKVKENPRMHIPIIGNGDINSPQKAKEYFDRYGVDAIMIGRATYGHPWIFKEIKHYLQTGELLPQMSVEDRVALAKRHLAKSLEIKGDRVGVLEMRRHLSCYFKGLPDFKETRLKLVTLNDPAELFATLDSITERWGGFEAPMATNIYNL